MDKFIFYERLIVIYHNYDTRGLKAVYNYLLNYICRHEFIKRILSNPLYKNNVIPCQFYDSFSSFLEIPSLFYNNRVEVGTDQYEASFEVFELRGVITEFINFTLSV